MENENKVISEATEIETKPSAVEKRCANCQAVLDEGQSFCPECGTPLKNLCQKCGAELQNGQAFCANCGQRANGIVDDNTNSAINQFNTNIANQRKKSSIIPAIICGICVTIAAIVILLGKLDRNNSFVENNENINFETYFADIADESWCDIADDGSYMTIDTNPFDVEDYFDTSAINKIEEINEELGFYDSLYQKMMETRSLDGRLSEENDKFKVSWTYHPDNGLEIMYEKK